MLAKAGIPVTLLTDDAHVPGLLAQFSAPDTAQLIYAVGFERSAEILGGSAAILLATQPNDRFSGATTVGVAAALSKPLILDEPFDLAAYGLEDGVNCLTFSRGDVDAARVAVVRILTNQQLAHNLGTKLASLAPALSMRPFISELEKSFKKQWQADDASWHAD